MLTPDMGLKKESVESKLIFGQVLAKPWQNK